MNWSVGSGVGFALSPPRRRPRPPGASGHRPRRQAAEPRGVHGPRPGGQRPHRVLRAVLLLARECAPAPAVATPPFPDGGGDLQPWVAMGTLNKQLWHGRLLFLLAIPAPMPMPWRLQPVLIRRRPAKRNPSPGALWSIPPRQSPSPPFCRTRQNPSVPPFLMSPPRFILAFLQSKHYGNSACSPVVNSNTTSTCVHLIAQTVV